MREEQKKALFRDFFRDWVEDKLQESFDSLHDVRRSRLMARFFAEQVLRPRNPTLLPFAEEDIQACVVDGKDDCGIDFISREEGTVLLIQAKFSGGKKAIKRPHEEPGDFDNFRAALERLRNFRKLAMSEALRELAADINWDSDNFQMYYITLRQVTANQGEIASQGVPSIADIPDLNDRVEISLLDENGLNLELRDALSVDAGENKTFRIQFAGNEDSPPWLRLGSGSRACYVGRVSGAQLASLFTQHRSSLFTLNIRNYIGDNSTNKAIKKTALDTPDDFFSFNNGISALATRIEPDPQDPRTLICDRLSIINGAQTVRSLHKAQTVSSAALRNVHVLLRITEFSAKKTQGEQEFLDNVTKFNNTQNTIKLSDFRSNDKVQSDLKRKFETLPYVDGKKFSYRNKRTGERERDVIAIGMEEFVKTLYAFCFGPDDVYGGTGHVFDATEGGGYWKLFNDGRDILPALSNDLFGQYAGIWFICDFAKCVWRARTREGRDLGLERRWMFYYALGESIRTAYKFQKIDFEEDLRRLSSHTSWIKQDDCGAKKVIHRHCKVAFKALIDAYKDASKDQGFAHRNWFRSSKTLASISEQLKSSWSLISDHGEEYIFSKVKSVSS